MKTQTFNWKQLVTTSTLVAFAAGCAPTGFRGVDSSTPNSKSTDNVVGLACVPDATDYIWDANIYGFSMSGTDFSVGYNGPVAGPITSIAVGASITEGSIQLQMSLKKPYDSATRSVDSGKQTVNSGFRFSIDLGIVRFGVGNSSPDGQAALISLTKKGYQALEKNAAAELAKDPNGWSTHITKQLDANRFVVPIGALAGLQYGDTFNVYKYTYDYESPGNCDSVVGGSKSVPAVPVATLVPLDIKDGYATMTLVGSPTTAIGVNDLLEVKALYVAKKGDKRTLKKSVRLNGIHQPNLIAVQGANGQASTIDLTSYLTYQIPSLMTSDANYWLTP